MELTADKGEGFAACELEVNTMGSTIYSNYNKSAGHLVLRSRRYGVRVEWVAITDPPSVIGGWILL